MEWTQEILRPGRGGSQPWCIEETRFSLWWITKSSVGVGECLVDNPERLLTRTGKCESYCCPHDTDEVQIYTVYYPG